MKNAGLLFLTFLLSAHLHAQEDAAPPFFAKVLAVTAANSLIVQPEGGERTQVVLAFLSIPVGEQPYSKRAHAILRAQLLNRRVSVRPIGEPNDDYVLGIVYVGKENFNLDFLSRGHAWVDHFQMSHPAWMSAQQAARAAGRGLYADPQAMHPLDWVSEMKKAKVVVGMTETMKNDPAIQDMFDRTFVGHRGEKVFVSTRCLGLWATWPRAALVAFTTTAGAEDNGYRQVPCPSG